MDQMLSYAEMQHNRADIQKWHDEQQIISQSLKEMQPMVRELLEKFMSFSDQITESYILQFANQQIELYDLIFDNYHYHKEKSQETGNQDYINAVSNYDEFMDAISDCLAIFGVEKISTASGLSFDGKIHEPDSREFSSKTAVVRESIRPGFRYSDLVLQKEMVKL